MLSDFGQFLADRSARTADVRDATITGYEGNGVYDCRIIDTGAPVLAVALVGMGRLDVGTSCTVAPMAAAGAANAPWRIISADTAKATPPPFIPPASIPTGPSVSRITANPTILTAGGASVDVVIEGSGLAAGPTYGDPGITDSLAPDVTSTRVAAHVKALATVAKGTISTTGTAVVGVGTNFTHFVDGQLFLFSGQTFRISGTPPDDTHLTLDHAPAADVSGVAYSVGYSITAAGTTIGDFFQVVAASFYYGASRFGGAGGFGNFYGYNPATMSVTPLYEFDGTGVFNPSGDIVFVNGFLYVQCVSDTGSHFGGVVKLELATGIATIVHSFSGTDGSLNDASNDVSNLLLVGTKIYGATIGGGANGYGTIFSIDTTTDTFTSLHDFDIGSGIPQGTHFDGTAIYGVSYFTVGVSPYVRIGIWKLIPASDTFSVVATFDETTYPTAVQPSSITPAGDGDTFYITTDFGGSDHLGSIEKFVLSSGVISTVASMTTAANTGVQIDGALLKVGSVYYGAASGGGSGGQGTLFKFTPPSTIAAVVAFAGPNGDGPGRSALLLVGADLYVVTGSGGPTDDGVIGKLDTTTDTYAALHEFNAAVDGSFPQTALVKPVANR